ncbi:hypothetical protein CEXT_805191 [Caerostris extrusa]|uniref:Uncharacterized protein n=1 Tax=Caerostris extrusa TaxID=172846 RepID=A0AAV4XZI4_CAEEX|nr:hypothetical protein CEXT_805191 [Caerostris extrusa]
MVDRGVQPRGRCPLHAAGGPAHLHPEAHALQQRDGPYGLHLHPRLRILPAANLTAYVNGFYLQKMEFLLCFQRFSHQMCGPIRHS